MATIAWQMLAHERDSTPERPAAVPAVSLAPALAVARPPARAAVPTAARTRAPSLSPAALAKD